MSSDTCDLLCLDLPHAEAVRAQRRAGRELGSASAVADARQTLLCTYLSAVLLVGLARRELLPTGRGAAPRRPEIHRCLRLPARLRLLQVRTP